MKRETRWILISIALVLSAFAFASYLFVSERERQQMAVDSQEAPMDIQASVLEEQSVGVRNVTLYFYNPGQPITNQTLLRLEEREVFQIEDPALMARLIVTEVLKEGIQPFSQGEGSTPPLQRLRQLYLLDDGTAVVDLESASVASIQGISAEMAFIESITRSLRENIEEIERIEFLVDGKEQATLAGHISLADPFM